MCALDTEFYCRHFFPRAFRQKSPSFHKDIFALLEDREVHRAAIKVFRDGAKTTILRAYASKRIAYGISRTILFVSEAQGHAVRSVSWLKKAIEHSTQWAQIYGLERGAKWTDELIEIRHRALGITVAVGAYGITGQVRGINIDDYRPDLIIVDDPCDEENTATEEQREKTAELFFGALEKTLAAESDAPDAKMVLLQTPLHKDDIIARCERFGWPTRSFSILNENNESAWPEKWSTEVVLKDKQEHIKRRQILLWLREKECKLTNVETSSFDEGWLKIWEQLPERMVTYIGLDPVPPPSERELAKDLSGKCDEAIVVVGVSGSNYYILDYATNKGHSPDWTSAKFFEFVQRWRPLRARVESINYQRTLKWFLELEMRRRKLWVQINGVSDKRKKSHRITQAFTTVAVNNALYIREDHYDFRMQFAAYPDVSDPALLDAGAMALDEALSFPVDTEAEEATELEDEPVLSGWRRAP